MKKRTFVNVVLVTMIALTMIIAISITAFADSNTSAAVTSNGKVARGDSITFSVKISNGTGIQGIAIIPSYDKSVFELVSGEWVVPGGLMPDFSVDNGDGVVAFSPAVDINTTVLTFTLKAKSDAPLGNQTVSAEVIVTDSNGNSNLTVTGSSVDIQCKHNYSTDDFTYLKSEASCSSPALYYKVCLTCGEHNTETFAHGEKLAHTYTENVADEYLKDAASCTDKAVYYVSCSVCGNKGTDTFESGVAQGHAYQSEWSSDSEKHWHECSVCGDKKDFTVHTPGAEATEHTAQKCTVCDYVIVPILGHTHNYSSNISSDDSSHWYSCSGCDEKKDVGEHIFDNNCDTKCNVCAYERNINHTFGTKLFYEDNYHWYECTLCGEKTSEVAHKWDNGKLTQESTETFSGIKTYSCKDCGAEKIELTPVKGSPNKTDNDNVNNNTSSNNSNPLMTVVAIVEGVVIVVLIVLLISKKKSNNVEKESTVSDEEVQNEQNTDDTKHNDTDI